MVQPGNAPPDFFGASEHVDHGNLATGAALSRESLDEAMELLRERVQGAELAHAPRDP